VPASLLAMDENRSPRPSLKAIRASRFREAEKALGRPVKPWEVDRIGLRSDGSVVMYDRPVRDSNRRRVAVHRPNAAAPVLVMSSVARPRERRERRSSRSSGQDPPGEPELASALAHLDGALSELWATIGRAAAARTEVLR
jgi:hypothetical protein